MVTPPMARAMLGAGKGKDAMRTALCILALIFALGPGILVCGPALAGDGAAEVPEKARTAAEPSIQDIADAIQRAAQQDACYGDRYETDADLNEGNRVTDEEILAVINRPQS